MANLHSGIESEVLIAPQGAFDTISDGAADVWKVSVLNCNIAGLQPHIVNNSLGGDRNSRDPAKGRITADGSLSILMTPQVAPLIWYWILGSGATTGASDPFTQTNKTLSGGLPWITIETFLNTDTPHYKQVVGAMVERAVIKVVDAGFVQADLTVAGGYTILDEASFLSSVVYDATTDPPFKAVEDLAAADVLMGGSAIADVMEWTLTIDNKLKKDNYVPGGSGRRIGITAGRQEAKWAINAFFRDRVLYDYARGTTPKSISLKWAASASRSLQLTTSRVFLTGNDPDARDDGPYMLPIEGDCSKDSSDGTQIKAITKNDMTGYGIWF